MNKPEGVINDSDPNALSIEEARSRILRNLSPCTDWETLSTNAALGRVLSTDVVSTLDVPPFRASAMDGYAVRSNECDKALTITGESLAGHPGDDVLQAFSAQRITTGARVPDDADSVVQQENVTREGNTIIVNQSPSKGLHVRNPGTDSAKGTMLLNAGQRIGPAERGLLAAHGVCDINVFKKLHIAMFSTGDELVEPGAPRQMGQINDANRALLQSMLDDPSVNLTDLGIAADSESALQSVFDRVGTADLVISSGGVSVGDADYVKSVLAKNGSMDVWKIAMKPGRPLSFGRLASGAAFFGLPGNPVSAALTCLLFVRPAIDHMLNTPGNPLAPLSLPLQGVLKKNPGRVEYQRAIIIEIEPGQWAVTTTGMQDSHVLSSLHKANCLIELPVSSTGATNGELVKVLPFTHFGRSPV